MTVEQYIEAANKQMEQERLNQLIQQNIPPELAQEILEGRKFRVQYQSEHQQIETQKKKDAE
jgi:hypothetical protein